MNINKVHAVYFSPGGTTKLCAAAVASAIGECEEHDFTSRAESLSLAASDAAVFAAPVFGGRIPGAFAGFLASVKGEDTPAVVLAVYGNRDYDDALLELADAVKVRGFKVVAAGAFIARHSIVTEIAAGRPDEADRAAMAEFGAKVRAKLEAGEPPEPSPEPEEWPAWVQPTGAHDCYNTGDKVTYNGQHYVSKIDGNVWSPEAYPAGWEAQA